MSKRWPVASALSGVHRVSAGVLPAGRYASLVYIGVRNGMMGNAAVLKQIHDETHVLLLRKSTWVSSWIKIRLGAEKGLVWDTLVATNGDGFGARFETYLTDPAVEPDLAKWEAEVAIRLADDQPRSKGVPSNCDGRPNS